VGVYVDDLIIFGPNVSDIKFSMSDLGLLSYYLGIEVEQGSEGITLSQSAYAPMEAQLKFCKIAGTPGGN
jgi:hypothetical protein